MIKKILGMTAVVAALIFTPTVAKAQKTAYIYLDSILLKMPEKSKADTALKLLSDKLTNEIEKTGADCQSKYDAYQENMALPDGHPQKWTKSKYALMEADIRDCQTNLQTFREQAEKDFLEENQRQMKPVVEKAKKVVEDVAKEKGYTLVINANAGMIVYSLPTDDLTQLVMKRLNVIK